MRYIKAEDVLPEDLIRTIWQYVDGVSIYIPRKPENRRDWGSATHYRTELRERNMSIRLDGQNGLSVTELSERYHLSVKSICRILKER